MNVIKSYFGIRFSSNIIKAFVCYCCCVALLLVNFDFAAEIDVGLSFFQASLSVGLGEQFAL